MTRNITGKFIIKIIKKLNRNYDTFNSIIFIFLIVMVGALYLKMGYFLILLFVFVVIFPFLNVIHLAILRMILSIILFYPCN